MVPNGWESSMLGDVCQIINGRPFKPHEWRESGLPIIRIQNLNGSNEYNYYDGEFSDKVLIKSGQLLFAWSGSKGSSFGPHIWNGPDGLLNYHTWRINVKDNVDSEFFFQYLRVITTRIESKAHGASALVHTQKGEMEKFPIVIPPLSEQRKIAQILSAWDRGIATTEKLIDASKQQKKALMQQLLTGKKRLVDPETGKAFEGEWEEVKLGDVISLGRGFAFKSSQYADSGTKVVRVTNIASSGHIDLSDCVYVPNEITNEYQKYALKNEDILLVMVGATAGKLGFVSENILPSLLNQNMWSLRTRNLDKLNQLFLRHIAERIVARYMLTQQGSARGFFTQSTFELVNFQVPSVEEQQKIASMLTAADKEIELLNAKLAHLKQEKKALMQQLLTGKRRVRVAETEAA
ncbi:restriction endonuclease subunit S [Vibrio alginolyticus]